ncbi:MAG: cytochrome C oxidase subunit IV family protein [Planctomycetota bacterium]|jgi:cytochrome c oxidase subunit IV
MTETAASETTTHHDPQHGLWSVKKVFIWLAVLTLAEVGVVYLPLSKMAIAGLLILGAVWKAALVAMHFMHLKVEKKFILWMLLISSVLAAIFVLGLVPDMVMGPGAGAGSGG